MKTIDIQRALNAHGAKPPLNEDDDFGRKTLAAVKAFQESRGIKSSGIVGPLTIAALNGKPAGGGPAPVLLGLPPPPWVEKARTKMGLSESRDNAELRAFLASDKHALGDPAKLPWCGDFIETCIALTLPEEPMIANPYYARNWAKFGQEVDPDFPRFGAVGVVSRTGGGHVFFIVGHDTGHWHALGGNQGNSVSIVRIDKDRTLAVRWPLTYPIPGIAMRHSTFTGAISQNEA